MPNPITFTLGWELEACRAAREIPQGVIQERDGSVSGDGREYKISPNLVTDPRASLAALEALCRDSGIHVNRTCGFHVHVGINGRSRPGIVKQWASAFVLLARRIEAHAFMAVPPSRRANQYCRSWRQDGGSVIVRRYNSHKYANDSRYQWVNVVEIFRPQGIRTVEIRLLGSTKRFPYLLAWAGVCHKMAGAAWRLISDPSALEHEAASLQEDFQRIASDVLTVRSHETAVGIALQLAVDSQLMPAQEARDMLPNLLSLARHSTLDPQETTETRFTEAQALIEAQRVLDPGIAHAAAISGSPAAIPAAPRMRRRRAAYLVAAVMAENQRAVQAQTLTRAEVETLTGYNPDAFAVIPTNQNGGSI